MAGVLQLLRLSLILRVATAVVAAVATSLISGTVMPAAPVTAMGSLAMAVIVSIALTRSDVSERTANGLLVATIIIQAIEAAILGLLFQGGAVRGFRLPEGPPLPGQPNSGEFRIASALLLRGSLGSALFLSIAAMLGAWIGGRRSVIAWTALAVIANVASDVIPIAPNWNALRFVLGSSLSQAVVVGILAFFVGSLADQLRSEQAQLKTANRQLREQAHVREQLAGSRERVRLARDLHDTLAHTLAGLVVQLNAIGMLLDKEPAAAQAELKKAQVVAKTGLEETRAAIGDLRANIVEDLGLAGALKRQTELVQQRMADASITFEQEGAEPELEPEKAATLFRIAQEALNNIERHANAQHVAVSMTAAPTNGRMTTKITVKDDGIGFDTSAFADDRFGLRGMRERAELIGAHLRIDSAPGAGTTVTVALKPAE